MVHIQNLRKNDSILLYPSTVDFEYLDSSATRFEIAYNEEGQRFGMNKNRPYLLSDFNKLEDFKKLVAQLNKNQLYYIAQMIQTKREDWNPTSKDCENGGVFWNFCFDLIKTAKWKNSPKDIEKWTNYAVEGYFEDAFNLYMRLNMI
ncbi:hypothetical protein [Methanolapillus ohkumae]|uniref:Uncharacterized protein n=1 Tax=Methanolapillus ohkumae TaxID=3028298 RepID=A0AA96V4Z8_9EURY|nr:hypothetical protein MsAm2_00830 [Methanosarcinaceae archaeon Am2]